MAISIVGLGVASTVGALTKINSVAGMSRNSTGAYTVAMNQIDRILSASPFNPQNKNDDGTANPQIPAVLTLGLTTTLDVPVYKDPVNGVVVPGTMDTQIQDISSSTVFMYRATVTVKYRYLNRNYAFSMSTIRSSDK
jgi:hypothetical protein